MRERLIAGALALALVIPVNAGNTRNVMITGYWPPTNEMIRRFSPNPTQNPQGWIGENWEGRGFNVYAYFPEFPGGQSSNPKGDGDFEVDYQDTSADWWRITAAVKPVAIITFSRGGSTNQWELEGGNRTYASGSWTGDYLTPFQPTADLPIMQLEPPNTVHNSSQPIAQIIAAVQASGANVTAFSSTIDNGRFLSNFIGYHGNWYRDTHFNTADPNHSPWCLVGGHVHVGQNTNLADAVLAAETTIRTVIQYITPLVPPACPGDSDLDGAVDQDDLDEVLFYFGQDVIHHTSGDADGDGDVDQDDLDQVLFYFGQGC